MSTFLFSGGTENSERVRKLGGVVRVGEVEAGDQLSRACVKHVCKFLRKSLAVLDAVWFR